MNAPSTFTIAILAILANGMLLFISRSQLSSRVLTAAQAWLYGTVAIVTGIACFLVPSLLPAGLHLVIPNALLLGGMIGYDVALRLYHQLPIRRMLTVAVPVLAVFGVLVFQWLIPDVRVRVLIVSLSWLWAMGDSLVVLYQGRKMGPSPARTALIWLYALVFGGTALRLAYFLLFPVSPTLSITDGSDWVNRMTPVLATLLPAAGSSAFMLMCYHHQYHAAHQQAMTDSLTGVGNRALLMRLTHPDGQAPARLFRVALLVDLDDFKVINDTQGHAMGDAVLVEAARRMRSLATPSDVVLRLGGDEFLMLLGEEHAPETIQSLTQALQTALAQPYGPLTKLSASIGVAVADDLAHPCALETLIAQADQAMYRAKRQSAARPATVS